MSYKILILENVRDNAAAWREREIKQAPELHEHCIEHLYVNEWAPLENTQPMPLRMASSQRSTLDVGDILRRIRERVDACQPDILIVNSGWLFHTYPEQMLHVLQSLKSSHPCLRIGFHPRRFEQHGPRPCFEYSAEMLALMNAIFASPPMHDPLIV